MSFSSSTGDGNRHGSEKLPAVQEHHHEHETDLADYFVGPRDMERHSKLPLLMRMHGSITPKMIIPLTIVGCWATLITCICQFVHHLIVSTVLLTVLGFVVAMGISFRTSSAYERYAEGRKYWAQLMQVSRDLARHIWIHAEERHEDPETGKADLLAKISALNLIVAFALALKHKLRFEPYASYPDLEYTVSHLSTFAGEAGTSPQLRQSALKSAGNYLGITFTQSNPRKLIKRSNRNLGNLPLEIHTYLYTYIRSIMSNDTFKGPAFQTQAMNNLAVLSEVLAGTERVLNTPLPVAYSIAISQITWVYVLVLPFQLWESLRWVTIPGTIVAAYIILGIAAIGHEIENPFGQDVNDLPLDAFCKQLSSEIDIIASKPRMNPSEFIQKSENKVMYPLSMNEYAAWNAKSVEEIREALKAKARRASVANEPTLPNPEASRMGVFNTSVAKGSSVPPSEDAQMDV